jgi:hypothetical protein
VKNDLDIGSLQSDQEKSGAEVVTSSREGIMLGAEEERKPTTDAQ